MEAQLLTHWKGWGKGLENDLGSGILASCLGLATYQLCGLERSLPFQDLQGPHGKMKSLDLIISSGPFNPDFL